METIFKITRANNHGKQNLPSFIKSFYPLLEDAIIDFNKLEEEVCSEYRTVSAAREQEEWSRKNIN